MKASNEATPEKLALRPRAAAETLGISESTLWRLRASGKLPAVKLGSAVLFRVADLQSFIAAAETVAV